MDTFLLILLLILAVLTAGLVAVIAWIRAQRRGALSVLGAHPGETVYPAKLIVAAGTTAGTRARSVAVLADAGGLSFRDGSDAELVRIAAERIMSIEFAPLSPRSAVRPARAALLDGSPVDFFLGVPVDSQVDAVVAIRAALGRS